MLRMTSIEEHPLRIGIISDIHGNSDALDVVLKALEFEDIGQMVCLGDVVGYGPEPDYCIQRVWDTADIIVAGNHDVALTKQHTSSHFCDHAKEALQWTLKTIRSENRTRLEALKLVEQTSDATWVHASPVDPGAWQYILYTDAARDHFAALDTPVCFIGHSHIPLAFVKDQQGEIKITDPADLVIDPNYQYIINVGSVGQPRDGDPRAAYGVWDTGTNRFHLKRLLYPVEAVQKKMDRVHLPHYLIERLAVGY